MEKDQLELETHKNQMIEEIKSINKKDMFVEVKKPKLSILKKILMIFGYVKKG